ncbi:MAG: hypothetical protein ACRD19_03485, partial [Terriglobia bacterium]
LNVRVVQAIGDNPKTKIIEAWHRNLDEFDKRFPGWCGSNTKERPERLADAERQHEAWTRGRAPSTPLARIGRYIMAYLSFCEPLFRCTRHFSQSVGCSFLATYDILQDAPTATNLSLLYQAEAGCEFLIQ